MLVDLDARSHGATLVVCDIEGFETELLDPQLATALLSDDILVEIHEPSPTSTEVEQRLQSRFETTHEIQRITGSDRLSWIEHHQPKLSGTLDHATLCKATEENRTTGRVWFWMQAKGG